MLLYRYSRWDGSQEVFPIREDDLMEQLSEQLMGQGDISSALRSIAQRGVRGHNGQRLSGVQDIIQRLRQRRQDALDRYNLGSLLDQLREQLEEVLRLERGGVERRLQGLAEKAKELQQQGMGGGVEEELLRRMERLARKSQEFLEQLPKETPSAIRKLREYEFLDPQAKARFDELLQTLQDQVLKANLRELAQQLQHLSQQDVQALKQMLKDLNRMLEERTRGGQPDFQGFMERYRHLLGSNPPTSLEQLVEAMQHQMAQLESLLSSLTPEQRRELQSTLDSAIKDEELLADLARLAANLEYLHPMGALRRDYPFQGDEPITLGQAMELMDALQKMDDLERQLKRTQHGASLEEVDPQLLQEVLGTEASQEMEQLKRLTDLLEEAGYIRRIGNRFELTPRGMRKIGQKALQEIFAYIKRDRTGAHQARQHGAGGERTEDTKLYEFGDPLDLELQRTIVNALFREAPGIPVHLDPRDFEVHRTEQLTQSSTVLMIDLSLSMAMRGNFLAAKKVALALDNLIRTRFPRDNLHIVGFSTYAREVKAERLPYLTWDEFDPYTNIQHGLMLSQRLLARISGGTKQIIMISDGEPTAHLEGGQLFLQYP
ncbi:MAG: VWA domain-containing protein, partial [Chloroflexi bacterium]|nr:VWA domain-containing protein [Chloroflexota bacterium]